MSAVEASPESVALDEEISRPIETSQIIKSFPNSSSNSKGLLLRLFQSDLFTPTQAVYYLGKYSNEPGIQFYLCERLRDMPNDQIEFLLPQIW